MKFFFAIFLFIEILFIGAGNVISQSVTWQRTYGDNNIDYGYSIVQTPDEGYIAVGRKRIQTTNYMFAMRLNKFGDTIWTRTFPGFKANQIEKTEDGNYVIQTTTGLMKIDVNGDTIWTNAEAAGARLKETKDKGFIICLSENNGPFLFYPKLKKVDSLGNVEWEKVYTDNFYDGRFSDITVDHDGNYIMTGNYSDTAYIWAYLFIMKTDSLGNLIWFRKYEPYHYSVSILIVQDTNYVVCGETDKSFLSKYGATGNRYWIRFYEKGPPERGNSTSAIVTNDGGLAFTGNYHEGDFNYYVRLIKTDSEGNESWRKLYGFGDADIGYDILQTSDSGYAIIGIRDNYNLGDIYIIKTDRTGYSNPPVGISQYTGTIPNTFLLLQNFPNPFNPTTKLSFTLNESFFVTLRIYDATGRPIQDLINTFKQTGSYEEFFNGSNLPSGIYFYSLILNNKIADSKKMLLIK